MGYVFDNQMISVIAYLAHQSSVEFIAKDSEEIKYLQPTKRNQTSSQIVDDIVKTFYQDPVPTWAQVLAEADFPHDYIITFAAIACTLVYLIFPQTLSYTILWPLI